MPTLVALLKEEISKIARKEVQSQVRELKKTVREQRDAIARLEKQIGPAKAKAATKSAAKPAAKPAAKSAAKPAAKVRQASAGDKRKQLRIAPNTIKKHRKRLKLSQADLGKILNVSTNTVLRWEAGTSKPRSKHLPGLDQLRTISKRELKKQLGA